MRTEVAWEANVEGDGDVFAGDLQIADCDFPQGELSPEDIRAHARLIAASPIGYELASEILRACDRATGRQISDVTRQEIEPLRKLAEQFMAIANGDT